MRTRALLVWAAVALSLLAIGAQATMLIQQGTVRNVRFLMRDSTDRVTGLTGVAPTVTIAKDGAGFTSPAGAVTEIGNGWYQLAATAGDTGTLGQLIVHASDPNAGADPADVMVEIVAYNPQDAAAGVWTYPTTSMGVAGSAGLLVTTDLNATVGSRSSHTPADIWDVAKSGHIDPNTFGGLLNTNINATIGSRGTSTLVAGDVWDVAKSLHADPNTFGGLVNTNLDTNIGSRGTGTSTLTAADVWGALIAGYTDPLTFGGTVGLGIPAIQTNTDKFGLMIEADGLGGYRFTTLALANGPVSASSADWSPTERATILTTLRRILSQVGGR